MREMATPQLPAAVVQAILELKPPAQFTACLQSIPKPDIWKLQNTLTRRRRELAQNEC